MAFIERTALLGYGAEDMYRLVGDIETYPQFLPGCTSARVEEAQPSQVRARLCFAVRGIRDSFVTQNRLESGRRIEMTLLEGPLRQLVGAWEFQALADDACKVTLRLTLEFGNRALELALSPWLDHAVASVMDAFRGRAKVLYGR